MVLTLCVHIRQKLSTRKSWHDGLEAEIRLNFRKKNRIKARTLAFRDGLKMANRLARKPIAYHAWQHHGRWVELRHTVEAKQSHRISRILRK